MNVVVDGESVKIALSNVPIMQWCLIQRIDHDAVLQKELERVGLFEGIQIRKIQCAFWGGPCGYEFLGSRCMIRKDLSDKIFCTPII